MERTAGPPVAQGDTRRPILPQHFPSPDSRVTVNIVEDHDDALQLIYREIGAKRVPFSNLALIHFDAHPDLMISDKLQADDATNKSALFDTLGIENWIFPAVFAGHFSTVVWIRPAWACQIPDTEPNNPLDLYIGKDPVSGLLKVSCLHDYFLSALIYSPAEKLKNSVPFKLYVLNGTDDGTAAQLRQITREHKYILDVDLDYFSCLNPFKKIFSSEEYEIIKNLYHFDPPKFKYEKRDVNFCLARRRRQLRTLEDIIVKGTPITDEYKKLAIVLDKGHDPEIIHNCGLTFDTTELPHHKSSELEIKTSMYEFSHLIACAMSSPGFCPSLITIARSSLDEYCPKDQVDLIQFKVIETFEEFYQMMSIIYHYEFVEYKGENEDDDGQRTSLNQEERLSDQMIFLNNLRTS
ncbi:UPF0489 protein C5orf22 homolog [Convolutriloba macropyga]|uniref:UPF0489 protein C5orf22 homolog n=1 Tax=Convolutriloba macropyga TaxID=536237 RepID=UPI003F51C65D